MANGADPIQQFIQNHMSFQQFMEGQRQFGAQQALMQRQLENQEINQFAALAPFVEQPEQRAALAQYFATRNPQMAETFAALAQSIPISEQVYRSQLLREGLDVPGLGAATATREFAGLDPGAYATSMAQAGRSPEDLIAGLRTAEGLQLSAAQQEQVNQFIRSFYEGQRQFDIEAAQRSRQLGIAETEVALRGEGQRLSFMASIGEGRPMLRGDLSRTLREIETQLMQPNLSPERRRSLELERSEVENAIRQIDNRIAAEMAALVGRAGSAGAAGLTPSQLNDAIETAATQVREAKDRGMQEEALQRLQFWIRQMQMMDPTYQAPNLEIQERARNFFLPNAPGAVAPIPSGAGGRY